MIEKEKSQNEECVFCKIVKGEIKADIIGDEENFIVMNDLNQDLPGHCLIIPKRHYKTIFDMPSSLGSELIGIAKEHGLRLIKEGIAEGIKLVNNNFSCSGQVVMHFHTHILPYKKDTKEKFVY